MEMEETVRLVPGEGIEDETFVQTLDWYVLSCSRDVFCFCISLDCMVPSAVFGRFTFSS
jgi:hypothetical protein